jgi:hypothetical protein
MAVGTNNTDGVITAASNSVVDVVGETPASLNGRQQPERNISNL